MKEQITWMKLTDESVIHMAMQDNTGVSASAQAELYRRYYTKVLNRCLNLNVSYSDAVEITNDIFIKVFQSLPFLTNKISGFGPWLLTITRNRCISWHRKRKLHLSSFEDYLEQNPFFDQLSEEELTELQEANTVLMESALEQLSVDDFQILHMYYIEGLSQKDICAKLNLGTSALKMKMKRAKSRALGIYLSIPK